MQINIWKLQKTDFNVLFCFVESRISLEQRDRRLRCEWRRIMQRSTAA